MVKRKVALWIWPALSPASGASGNSAIARSSRTPVIRPTASAWPPASPVPSGAGRGGVVPAKNQPSPTESYAAPVLPSRTMVSAPATVAEATARPRPRVRVNRVNPLIRALSLVGAARERPEEWKGSGLAPRAFADGRSATRGTPRIADGVVEREQVDDALAAPALDLDAARGAIGEEIAAAA